MQDKVRNTFDEPILLDKIHQVVVEKKLNLRTEQTYKHWILKFISFTSARKGKNNQVASQEASEEQVNRFLRYLNSRLQLSKARMNQARQALEFYFAHVIERPRNQ